MGAQQLDSTAAKQLNALERKLALCCEKIKEEQERHDFLWRQVYDLFDHELGEGAPARFVCEDGYVLARIVPTMKPTINVAKLTALILKHVPGLKGTRMVNRVVVLEPRVDQKRLAAEVVKGRLSEKVVRQCLTQPVGAPRRYRDKASKHYRQAVEAGILESPSDELEEEAS